MSTRCTKSVGLLALPALLVLAGSATRADVPPGQRYHIETAFVQRVKCVQQVDWRVPNADVYEFGVIAALPPELPGQRLCQSAIDAPGWVAQAMTDLDLSPEHRTFLRLTIPVSYQPNHRLRVGIVYVVDLYSRRLVAGAPTVAVAPLSVYDSECYLESLAPFDYADPHFQAWLDAHSLRRRPAETDIGLAYRAATVIRSLYRYEYIENQDRTASILCTVATSDCGGLSDLFAGVMRANSVPARTLIGAHAASDAPHDPPYGQRHVRAEFFARDIGWLQVDESMIVSYRNKPVDTYFATDPGDMVTFHIDPNMQFRSDHFGLKTGGLQTPYVEVVGPGSLKASTLDVKWSVTKIR